MYKVTSRRTKLLGMSAVTAEDVFKGTRRRDAAGGVEGCHIAASFVLVPGGVDNNVPRLLASLPSSSYLPSTLTFT